MSYMDHLTPCLTWIISPLPAPPQVRFLTARAEAYRASGYRRKALLQLHEALRTASTLVTSPYHRSSRTDDDDKPPADAPASPTEASSLSVLEAMGIVVAEDEDDVEEEEVAAEGKSGGGGRPSGQVEAEEARPSAQDVQMPLQLEQNSLYARPAPYALSPSLSPSLSSSLSPCSLSPSPSLTQTLIFNSPHSTFPHPTLPTLQVRRDPLTTGPMLPRVRRVRRCHPRL